MYLPLCTLIIDIVILSQVNFSEPLSFLQRLMEDNEYAEVLHQAALCKDSCEQLAYVAAFTVSSYSTTTNRSAKPFNPLLGETYEFDRMEDLGWRSFTEQVCKLSWVAYVSIYHRYSCFIFFLHSVFCRLCHISLTRNFPP